MRHRKSILFVLFIAFTLSALGQQATQDYKILFEKAKFTMETKGDLKGAINLFGDLIKKYPKEREYAAKSQLYIGLCYEKLGAKEAQKAYESVLSNYADQAEPTKVARERLSAITNGAATSKGTTEIAMRLIWTTGKERPFTFSRDGKYVIYVSSEDNDLWLRDLLTGERIRVTKESNSTEWAGPLGTGAISPNGKQIVYNWWYRYYAELRLSNLDGSSMKLLHSGMEGTDMIPKVWLPDGSRILAIAQTRKDNTYQRAIISMTDGSIKLVGKVEDEEMSWGKISPDGHYIAHSSKGDIFMYNPITDKDTILLQNPAYEKAIGWTPKGAGILFNSDRSGTRDLYSLEIKHGKPLGDPVLIRRNVGNNIFLTNDGRLLSIEDKSTMDSFTATIDEQTGKVTGTPMLVDANFPNARFVTWSPDGKLMYYQTIKGPADNQSRVLVIKSEETGKTREIVPKIDFWYRPVLSPDGKSFSITGHPKDMDFGVYAIDAEKGEVTQLAKIPTANNPVDPAQNWSPDGKSIYYKVRSLEKSEIFLVRQKDLATVEEKDLDPGIHTMGMKISPDGTQFVYARLDKSTKSHVLGILNLQMGKEFVVWRVPQAESSGLNDPSWSSDGKFVMVSSIPKPGTDFWRFPAAGGEGEKLYSSPFMCWGFVMHPNGKRVAFTQTIPNYEVWVLENFLPK